MNKVFLIGNVVTDPHLTTIVTSPQQNKETYVVTFKIVVYRKFQKSNGEMNKETTHLKCEAWDSGAQIIHNTFKKGDKIHIEGSIQNESWVDGEGNKQYRDKIRINSFNKLC